MDNKVKNKVNKLVSEIESLLLKVVDSENEPLKVVIDTNCTIEHKESIKSIKFVNSRLTINVLDFLDRESIEIVSANNIEFDGIPYLQMIKRAYTKALKNLTKI